MQLLPGAAPMKAGWATDRGWSSALLWLPLCLVACGGLGRQLSSGPHEFQAYREARAAPDLGRRLSAAQAYLERYPRGEFEPELRAWFSRTEPKYYERLNKRRSGLEHYLRLLPEGPHAEAARDRIAELDMAREYARRRSAKLAEDAARVEDRLATAERLRDSLVAEYSAWIRMLAALDTWGQPSSELAPEFIRRWRVDTPAARCVGDQCAKLISLPYAIPSGGKLRARQAIFDVRLELTSGGVSRALITGPQLFDRLSEALSLTPASEADPLAHAEAIARAVQLSEQMLEGAFPSARCTVEAISPVVIHRECDGRRVRVVAAVEAGEEDRLIFEPAWLAPQSLQPAREPPQPEPEAPPSQRPRAPGSTPPPDFTP